MTAAKLHADVQGILNDAAALSSGTLPSTQIGNGTVTAAKLADFVAADPANNVEGVESVTTAKISDLAVTKGKLAQAVQNSLDLADASASILGLGDKAVLETHLNNGAVSARTIANNAVTAEKLAQAVQDSLDLADASASIVGLADKAVLETHLSNGAVSTRAIANEAVTAAKLHADVQGILNDAAALSSGTLPSTQIGNGTVTADKLAGNLFVTPTVNGALDYNEMAFADGAVVTAALANLAVTTGKIAGKAVTFAKLSDDVQNMLGNIGVGILADNSIEETHFNEGVVSNRVLANGAVTEQKLATGLLTAMQANAVATTQTTLAGYNTFATVNGQLTLAAEAVMTGHLANLAVTGDKLASSAVTTAKILDGTITADDIAAGTIGLDRLTQAARNSIMNGGGGSGGGGTGTITAGSITIEHLHANVQSLLNRAAVVTLVVNNAVTVPASAIADEAIDSSKIANNSIMFEDLSNEARDSQYAYQQQFAFHDARSAVAMARMDLLNEPTPQPSPAPGGAPGSGPDSVPGSAAQAQVTNEAARNLVRNAITAFEDGDRQGVRAAFEELSANHQSAAADLARYINSGTMNAQDIGERTDKITGFEDAADTWTQSAVTGYGSSSLRAQANYWADRIGLDPNVAGDRAGSLQARTNFLLEGFDRLVAKTEGYDQRLDRLEAQVSRTAAMTASLQDPYIPAGHRGGMTLGAASFAGKTGLSFSMGSIVGTRAKLSVSGAVTRDSEDRIFRLGYSLAW